MSMLFQLLKKEFKKAVNQPWKNSEPYPEYQK